MRITPPTYEQMTPEQRAVHDAAVSGKRGRMPPPALAWIHSPELAMRAQHLGEYIRYDTVFGPALVEIAILVTARYWRSHYEWWAHRRLAENAGLDPAIIDAIRDGNPLPRVDEKTQVIFDYAKTLHETRQVPIELHNRMLAAWGPRGIADIIGVCGYYTLVSMTLNGFDIGLPDGEVSEI
jgi:4-carboxymuconolactone decarboxylase